MLTLNGAAKSGTDRATTQDHPIVNEAGVLDSRRRYPFPHVGLGAEVFVQASQTRASF